MEPTKDDKLWRIAKRRASFKRSLYRLYHYNSFSMGDLVDEYRPISWLSWHSLANMGDVGMGNRTWLSVF